MKCKLHANDRYKTYLTWLLWSVEVTLTKKEMCKLNSAEVIRYFYRLLCTMYIPRQSLKSSQTCV